MLISIERKTVRSEQPSKTYNIKQKRLSVKSESPWTKPQVGRSRFVAISLVSELAVFPITGDWK